MAVTITGADVYFTANVLHNAEWVSTDTDTKQRALNNARNQIYRLYKNYREIATATLPANPAPEEAVFEQALWLLRLDDALLKAPAGLTMVTVSGISVQVANVGRYICPEAQMLLGRRLGRYST